MNYHSLLPVVLLLLAPIHADAQEVAGTYNFRVMNGDSAETQSIATGTFVLMEDSVPTNKLPAALLEKAQQESRWLLFPPKKVTPSACFGFKTSTREVDGREFYGGIIPAGLTTWELQGDTVRVDLYQSPDSWMDLKGSYSGNRISGVVWQDKTYGDWNGPGNWLPFEAKRTGPASIDACRAAIKEGFRLDRE